MIYEQTVVVPRDHKLHLDLVLPDSIPPGEAFIRFSATPPATMILSETSLAKDWNTSEEDEAWENL